MAVVLLVVAKCLQEVMDSGIRIVVVTMEVKLIANSAPRLDMLLRIATTDLTICSKDQHNYMDKLKGILLKLLLDEEFQLHLDMKTLLCVL